MKFKRAIALLTALVLLLCCFAACGKKDGGGTTAPAQPADRGSVPAANVWKEVDPGPSASFKGLMSRAGEEPERKLTVITYIIGADLESDGGFANNDLIEMRNAAPDDEDINLMVFTGGTEYWHCGFPTDRNLLMRYYTGTEDFELVEETETCLNMGNAQTLTDVLDYCAEKFPAENYGLILWDHGGGSVRGYGVDMLHNRDGLMLPELEYALRNSVFGSGKKLEFVGFDACLMATFETASVLAPYAKYMIASEELEPGSGWDYSFLSGLTGSETGAQIAEKVIRAYAATEDSIRQQIGKKPDMTLSCLDLSKTAAVKQALNTLSEKLRADLGENFADISRMRTGTKEFAAKNRLDHIDLGHFAALAAGDWQAEADALSAAVKALVVHESANVKNANGVSAYFPCKNKTIYTQYGGEELLSYAYGDGDYGTFAADFYTAYTTGEVPAHTAAQPAAQEGEYFTLTLTEEERKTFAGASYSVYKKMENGTLSPVLRDVPVKPDANGVIRVAKKQYGLYFENSLGSRVLCPSYAVEAAEDRTVFKAVAVFSTDDTFMPLCERQYGTVLFSADENNEVELMAILADDESFADRKELDLYDYNCLQAIYYCYTPAEENGAALPFSAWEQKEGSITYELLDISDDAGIVFAPLDTALGEFVLQIEVTDVYGSKSSSGFFTPESELSCHTVAVDVPDGKLTFAVYDDHAELIRLDGEPAELTVPDTVEGKPVTVIGYSYYNAEAILSVSNSTLTSLTLPDTALVIGDDAFRNCTALTSVKLPANLKQIGARAFFGAPLEELTLPESLVSIGAFAFKGTGISAVTVPASVTDIGEGAFSYCRRLEAVEVASGNRAYKSEDGVLFTANGMLLLCYPAAKAGDTYTLPEDTLRIGDAAFFGASLTSVDTNEALREIGCYAFYEMMPLKEVKTYDALERIGAYAFYKTTVFGDAAPFESFYIGDKLSFIGKNAFNGCGVKAFEVSEENTVFSANGSFLLDASGTVLVGVGAMPEDGVLTVPDGVAVVTEGALDSAENLTELTLPDSVSIFRFQLYGSSFKKLNIGAGLRSIEAWNLPEGLEIVLSENNPYLKLQDGKLFTADGTDLSVR